MNVNQEKLLDLLINDETALETAREHLEIDFSSGDAFSPSIKVKEESILNNSTADERIIGFLNERSRRSRKRKFERKIKSGDYEEVIISEGDSWFQFPVFLKDVIDHLSSYEEYAIRSFGHGADWLSNIVEQAEFINHIRYHKARFFLISGGGNDLLQSERIKEMLVAGDQSIQHPAEYFKNDKREEIMGQLKTLYARLFSRLNRLFPDLNILCHGYDYAIPTDQRWLGGPMEELGIPQGFRSEIVQILMDSFYDMLEDLEVSFNNVHVIDNRNTVGPDEWFDELHPRNFAFLKVAENFRRKIEELRS